VVCRLNPGKMLYIYTVQGISEFVLELFLPAVLCVFPSSLA
jgi:hypothetical protein